MTMHAPWRVEISAEWTEQLQRIGLIEIGYFAEADLQAAGVKELMPNGKAAAPARPNAEAGRLAADEPELLDVIGAISRASFVFGSWWQTNSNQTAGLAGDALYASGERVNLHGVWPADGEPVALMAQRGEVWRYSLARLDVAAEQLAAATFSSGTGGPAPDTFIGGWVAGWPAPPPARTNRSDHMDILGVGEEPDTRVVIIRRTYGVEKESQAGVDVNELGEKLRVSLQTAADDAARR